MSVYRVCTRPVSVAVWGLALAVCSFGVPPAVAQFTNNLNDMCANGPNKYFCDSSCNTYYYCNGKAKGTSLDCPAGTVCNKLGPHDKVRSCSCASFHPSSWRLNRSCLLCLTT